MRLRNLLIVILSATVLILPEDVDAQTGRKNRYKKRRQANREISNYTGNSRGFSRFRPYYIIGGNINAGNYFGDLAPVSKNASTDISFTRSGIGVFAGYKFHRSMTVRAALNWVRIYGDDFSSDPSNERAFARYARNLSFRNDIKELQAGVEFSLLPNRGNLDQRKQFNAYAFLGAAIFLHEPRALVPDADYQSDLSGSIPAPLAGKWVKLRPLGTEGQHMGLVKPYSNFSFSIPIAIGGTARLPNSDLNIGLEFGIRYLFTDYIDDVSTNYVDLGAFDSDLARILSDRSVEPTSSRGNTRQTGGISINNSNPHGYYTSGYLGSGTTGVIRGNPNNNDMIFVSQIKLTYFIAAPPRRRAKFR